MTSNTSAKSLFKHVGELSAFVKGLAYLQAVGTERITVSQILFFSIVALGDAAGKPRTLKEITEDYGDLLNASVMNTYKVLLEASPRNRRAVGWIYREPHPDDERSNYLRLTPRGREIALGMMEKVNGSDAIESDA